MSVPPAATPPKKRDLLRWVVWPAVIVGVALGAFEIFAKRQAEATAAAWRGAADSAGETEAFRASELDALVSGSPKMTEASPPAAVKKEMPFVDATRVYAWSGLFRKYVVRVHLSRGADPEVEAVDGP